MNVRFTVPRKGSTGSVVHGEAAIRRRLTLERQVTNTLLPDCAIKPPVALADCRSSAVAVRWQLLGDRRP